MELYFFRSADKNFSLAFRQFITRQNFKVAKVSSYVVIVFTLTLLVASYLVNFSALQHKREYGKPLLYLLIASVIFSGAFSYVKKIKNRKAKLYASYFSSSIYSIVIISGMMWLTFIAQHNPANTMTMFLVGMFYVASLWLLDIWEAVALMVLSMITFTIGLHYFQTDPEKLTMNYITGSYILVAFYIISRVLYSYHLNFFMQLKTIESKNREIGKVNKMQTEMLGIVVHDLRSPINSITTLTDLVKNYADTDTERNEYYEMILSACSEADHIIQDLIAVAKEQDQNIKFTETNINHLLEKIMQNWQHRLPDDRTLHLTQTRKLVYASIDADKIQRVIDNLIANAIKFTHEEGIIHLQLKENNNRIRISVIDDGVGVPDSLRPFLFERFSKAGRLGLKGEKSHGLGLSICRQIIDQHSGAIGVESKENVGSTFYIDLPLSKIAENTETKFPLDLETINKN